MRLSVQMMHPLPFPRISAAAKATQQQLARHLSLHSSTVMLVFMSTDALCVSGSFTPGTNMKPSVVGPFPVHHHISPASGRSLPHLPLRGRRRAEALEAAAEPRGCCASVADAERPTLAVVVADVPRPMVLGLPSRAVVPHEAIHVAGLRHHDVGEGRAGLDDVTVRRSPPSN